MTMKLRPWIPVVIEPIVHRKIIGSREKGETIMRIQSMLEIWRFLK